MGGEAARDLGVYRKPQCSQVTGGTGSASEMLLKSLMLYSSRGQRRGVKRGDKHLGWLLHRGRVYRQ